MQAPSLAVALLLRSSFAREMNSSTVLPCNAVDMETRLIAVTKTPFFRTLSSGAKGNDVEQLQAWLAKQGYLAPNEVDGQFGQSTRAWMALLLEFLKDKDEQDLPGVFRSVITPAQDELTASIGELETAVRLEIRVEE